MKKTPIVILIAAIVFVGAGIWFLHSPDSPSKYTGPVEKINFSSSLGVKNAAVYIAKDKGYFQEEGLEVNLNEVPSAKQAFLNMLNDKDVDISAVADIPVVISSFERNNFYILATISEGQDEKVIARKDRGINTVKDLKGKKVGLSGKGIGNHFFLSTLLTYNGLTKTDLEIIFMDSNPAKLLPALENGTLDAIAVVEPDATKAKELLGNNAVAFSNQGIYKKTFNLTVRKDFAQNHPETLIRFLKAIDKANKFIRENKEKSQTLLAGTLKLDKKDVTTIWDENPKTLSLDQSLLLTLEDEARWAIKEGLVDKKEVPNYLNFIYFDALESVKPEAVTIIH